MITHATTRGELQGLLVIAFVFLALLRVFFAARITEADLPFFPKISIAVTNIFVNIVSAVGTAIFGHWVIIVTIYQACSPYYILAVIETIILLSIAMSPGYFTERRLLFKYIPDTNKCSKLALISAIFMLILSLLFTYFYYSIEMGKLAGTSLI